MADWNLLNVTHTYEQLLTASLSVSNAVLSQILLRWGRDRKSESHPAEVMSRGMSPAWTPALGFGVWPAGFLLFPPTGSALGRSELPRCLRPRLAGWHYYGLAGSGRRRKGCPKSGGRRRQWRRCGGSTATLPSCRSGGGCWIWCLILRPLGLSASPTGKLYKNWIVCWELQGELLQSRMWCCFLRALLPDLLTAVDGLHFEVLHTEVRSK